MSDNPLRQRLKVMTKRTDTEQENDAIGALVCALIVVIPLIWVVLTHNG